VREASGKVEVLGVGSCCDLWLGDASLWPSACGPSASDALQLAGICSVIVVLRFLRTRGLQRCQACSEYIEQITMIQNGNLRALDVQGGALLTCTAAAGQTLDLLCVASRAGLDVRWLLGRHHSKAGDQIRRFIKTISPVAVGGGVDRRKVSQPRRYRSAEVPAASRPDTTERRFDLRGTFPSQ